MLISLVLIGFKYTLSKWTRKYYRKKLSAEKKLPSSGVLHQCAATQNLMRKICVGDEWVKQMQHVKKPGWSSAGAQRLADLICAKMKSRCCNWQKGREDGRNKKVCSEKTRPWFRGGAEVSGAGTGAEAVLDTQMWWFNITAAHWEHCVLHFLPKFYFKTALIHPDLQVLQD